MGALCALFIIDYAGMLLQPLARLGGSITGVDASREAIGAAQVHAQGDESLNGLLNYSHGTAEELQSRGTCQLLSDSFLYMKTFHLNYAHAFPTALIYVMCL